MAGYFTVDTAFWSDPDVADNYTPEDKYFYLYLLTCPNANISGCYEISTKQMSYDTGYSRETIERLIDRFLSVHRVIDYSKENKEVLVCNWGKYHWTSSPKYIKALKSKIEDIKTEKFRKFLTILLKNFENADERNTVWIPYQYGMDTSFTSSDSYTSSVTSSEESIGGTGGKGEGDDDLVSQKKNDDIIAQAKTVIDVWNSESCLPEIKRCSPSSERGKMLIARIKEYGVDDVIEAVHLAGNSKFLLDAAWFDFSWFVKPNNFIKVLEGKYNRQSSLVEEFTGNMFFDNAKEMVRNERFGS